MRDFFQEQLKELNRELVRMGADCEEIIALASQALTDWDEELVQKVNTKARKSMRANAPSKPFA